MRKPTLLLMSLALLLGRALWTCDCGLGSIALYEFDVKVPRPTDPNPILRYRELFRIGRLARAKMTEGQSSPKLITRDMHIQEGAGDAFGAALSPMATIVTQWVKKKRDGDPGLAHSNPDGMLNLRPSKRILDEGETTDVGMEMLDCDGVPLKQREIHFEPGRYEPLGSLEGTTNGNVDPPVVVTDDEGKAHVNYTESDQRAPADIRAWYGHHRPKGTASAITGQAAVTIGGEPLIFRSVFDAKIRNDELQHNETHHFEIVFGPAGTSGTNCTTSMQVGERCMLPSTSVSASATSKWPGGSHSASLTSGSTVAEIIRTPAGATLKFGYIFALTSPDRDEEHYIGVCIDQPWLPDHIDLTEQELRNFSTFRKTLSISSPLGVNNCVGSGTMVLGGDSEPVDDEMVFEPSSSYESWIPAPKAEDMPGVRMEPAAPLQVIARIQPKKEGGKARKGRINFVLDEVSKHRGQCGNYPQNASPKDDLRFADKQPAGIVVDGKYTAHTSDGVSEAAVIIEATDTGAYGKLKASAPDLQLEAIYKPTNAPVLTIPRDDDRNHVADAWDQQMNAHGTQDSDEDQVSGQDRTGDGLTYFDEYRGFVVVENGDKVFRRFDPKRKELLVIDPAGIFDSAIWEQASGIIAHLLDESLIAGGGDPIASRLVNFNSDSGHPKYAVRVVSMPGSSDPDDPEGENQSMGITYCEGCRSPKDAKSCKVFPARIRAKIEDLYQWLGLALAQPTSPQGQELAGAGFPPWLAQRAHDNLRSPASREALVRQFTTQIAIHEVGHACGLSDHQSGSPPGLSGAPVRACPMYIPADTTYHRFILLQTLFRPDADLPMQYSRFCRGVGLPEFDCFRKLNVKDW